MKDTIYLLTSARHRDFLVLNHYCTSEKTLIAGVSQYYNEMFNQETKDFEVDFNKEKIDFKYLDELDEWEPATFYFISIEKIKSR